MQAGSKNRTNSGNANLRNTVQGEAHGRKYNGIKQCGGEAFLQSDWKGWARQDEIS
jgi:hypothetical protein